MTQNKSFQRKIIYGVCMIVLLVLISMISRPATIGDAQGGGDPGGLLAQKRAEYQIAQTEIGQLDPASEAMRLSMVGLDGVATLVMWMQLHEYQKKEKYSHVEALCERIAQVNPHFLSVWEFQAWNLSYNVSREFDNYEHRYLWVKKGASFQMKGTKHNYNQPKLMDKIGHFFGMKMGMADEKKQYREIFPLDTDFHQEIDSYFIESPYNINEDAAGVGALPDNWLVGRMWSLWSQQVVDLELGNIGNATPAIFHSQPVKRLMNFANAIEDEGHIGDIARKAWSDSNNEWDDFGNRDLMSSWGIPLKLNDSETLNKQINEKTAEFDKVTNNLRDKLKQKKREKLSEEAQIALKTPEKQRTTSQLKLALEAKTKLQVSRNEVIKAIEDEETRIEASRIGREIDSLLFQLNITDRQKSVVHFDYWKKRSEIEGTDEAIKGRKLVYDAHQAFINANLVEARRLYEEAWVIWESIYKKAPILIEDSSSADLMLYIREYRNLLNQLDEDITGDFPLLIILQMHDEDYVPPRSYDHIDKVNQDNESEDTDSKKEETEPATKEPVTTPEATTDNATLEKETEAEDAEKPQKNEEAENSDTSPVSEEATKVNQKEKQEDDSKEPADSNESEDSSDSENSTDS